MSHQNLRTFFAIFCLPYICCQRVKRGWLGALQYITILKLVIKVAQSCSGRVGYLAWVALSCVAFDWISCIYCEFCKKLCCLSCASNVKSSQKRSKLFPIDSNSMYEVIEVFAVSSQSFPLSRFTNVTAFYPTSSTYFPKITFITKIFSLLSNFFFLPGHYHETELCLTFIYFSGQLKNHRKKEKNTLEYFF